MKHNEWIGFPGIRSIGSEEIEAVTNVLKSGNLYRGNGLTQPTECVTSEKELRQLFNRKYTLLFNSGTSALQAALRAINIQANDEVIIPGFGWITALAAVIELKAIPVFAPIKSGLLIDIEKLKESISTKTKAIIVTHACGQALNLPNIIEIARHYDIPIVDDACQALGAKFQNYEVGSLSDISVFSFQAFKIITCGEGGAIATDNKNLYDRMLQYHDAGLNRFSCDEQQSDVMPHSIGFNYRMSELHSAVLNAQLKKLSTIKNALYIAQSQIIELLTPLIRSQRVSIPYPIEYSNHTFIVMEAFSTEFAHSLSSIFQQKGIVHHIAANDLLHAQSGWIKYLKNQNSNFIVHDEGQTAEILKKTIILQVNPFLSQQQYLLLKECILCHI